MKKRIRNHTLYTFLFFLFLAIGVGVYAQYTTPLPNPGHPGTQILVDVNGEENLQTALEDINTRLTALEITNTSGSGGSGGPPSGPGGCAELISYTGQGYTQAIPVPPACIGRACTLMLERYGGYEELVNTNVAIFFQSPHANNQGYKYWKAIDQSLGKNGDSTDTLIFSVGYTMTNINYNSARVFDDKSGVETSPDQWTFTVTSYQPRQFKLYLCS